MNESVAKNFKFSWLFEKPAIKKLLFLAFSYLSITFGQPSGSSIFCAATTFCAFGLFFLQILSLPSKQRFFAGFFFFALVQAVQLFWLTLHPFLYIWAVYILLCILMGAQFGLLCLMATKKVFSSRCTFLVIPAFWVLMEWSRLFWFSGFYFNLTGIALTDNILTLQMASLMGVLGLSFWTLLTNSLFTRYILIKKLSSLALLCGSFALPYLFGFIQLSYHSSAKDEYDRSHPPFKSLIFHAKIAPDISNEHFNLFAKALMQWKKIIEAIGTHRNEKIDLILLPEGSVLFGNRSAIFHRNQIQRLFVENLGYFPFFEEDTLCSEEIAYEISRHFNCPLIMGLEGSDREQGEIQFFNSAFFFSQKEDITCRYDKQVLVPMGEYIPFDWAKSLASKYGIIGSFAPGRASTLFENGPHKIGSSICYEETFGDLMRQNRLLGATILVNLTDDYWFPYSSLAIQHYDHARPRTVENGIPLIRSCNFGISGAIDSFGRPGIILKAPEKPSAFIASVSSYSYPTLYSQFGDKPLVIFSFFVVFLGFLSIRSFSNGGSIWKLSKNTIRKLRK